jgi:hypothetical protein
MIKIFADGNKVIVQTEYKYPGNGYYTNFDVDAGNKLDAQLRAENLNDHLAQSIQRIRKEEYNRGWKDAKSKKKKEDWFSSTFK